LTHEKPHLAQAQHALGGAEHDDVRAGCDGLLGRRIVNELPMRCGLTVALAPARSSFASADVSDDWPQGASCLAAARSEYVPATSSDEC
jgi:hypothetical protein